MLKELQYPFNSESLISQKRKIRKLLLSDNAERIKIRVAILGGETTNDIKNVLELFLLNYRIEPAFYESEYNQYYEDGMFPNPELESFAPDIIYVCTCIRNILDFPTTSDNKETVSIKKQNVVDKFYGLWDSLRDKYNCAIIQNNFDCEL